MVGRRTWTILALVSLLSGASLSGGSSFGVQRALADVPVTTPNVVVPPGQPGWLADTVYTATGPTIYLVGGDGSLTPFVTLACDQVDGLTFDEVGSFNDRLIATCLNGAVYTMSPSGAAALLTVAPTGLSVPVVVPASLSYAGLLAASDALGMTWTVSPSGDVHQLPFVISPGVAATVTGGGTILVPSGTDLVVASFGLNARRTPGSLVEAIGRINYDKHADVSGNHVTVPVVFMAGESGSTPAPNGTGGSAVLVGDCTPPAECPSGFASVLVYVEDNADSGSGSDVLRIFYCVVAPFLPPSSFNGTVPPAGCTGPEGLSLRTGNIQVR